jgi:hypothetical protein
MEEPPDKVDNELTDPNEIKRFKEFFSIVTKDLKKSNCILEYYIETTDQKPVSFEPYGRSIFEKELLNKDVDEMIRANIIEPDDSIEGFWSEYSNFLKLKTSFEEVEIDLTNPNDIRMVKEFLTQNSDLFAESTDDLEENFSILKYHIVTTDEKTTSFKPYGRSAFDDDLLDKDVVEMLKANIIEPSNSPFSVQGFFLHKVDPEVINPNLMPLNANETPVFVSTG